MSPEWNPTDPQDQDIKNAFANLSLSIDKVVLPPSNPNQPNRFILRSKAYFGLQAYVLSGKELPTRRDEFDAKLRQTALRKLTNIDDGIYDRTKGAMVAVGSSCLEYYDNHLHKLLTAGRMAIQFSEGAIELLESARDINLRHALSIILHERYTSRDNFDDAYYEAKEIAKMTLEVLRQNAREKQRETEDIRQTLIGYKTGSVTNRAHDNKTPYIEYLNKDLADSLATLNKKVKEVQDQYSDWETNTAISIATCWIVGLGFTLGTAISFKAKPLRDAFDALEGQISRLEEDREAETSLITLTSLMATQCTDIDMKMTGAIGALTELSLFFSNQFDCYEKISESLDGIRGSPNLQGRTNRKIYIDYQAKTCVDKLKDLKAVALEFTTSILTQVKL
ncbi:hypothetical protein NM208_g8298 [Fusarium decemcellulare]|uniref:Uncharacterized protein n=1 Tax=Fusarium decemcellulare TaxID=57161 RepID=A0ACC1S5T8_9HYPO|nr:hypothetical protein NM208_g8298 [Fusarium decemcellulare]